MIKYLVVALLIILSTASQISTEPSEWVVTKKDIDVTANVLDKQTSEICVSLESVQEYGQELVVEKVRGNFKTNTEVINPKELGDKGNYCFEIYYELMHDIALKIGETFVESRNNNQIKIEYTKNSIAITRDNQTTMKMYSTPTYADSEGTKLEDLASLKECEYCGNMLNVKEDILYPVEVLDYNLTSINICFKASEAQKSLTIPYSIISPKTTRFGNKTIETHNLTFKSTTDSICMVLPFGFGKEIHFGETSTTVTLDYSDTAEDFNVCETSDCWEDAGYQGRWDVSSIPSVTSAVICLYGGEDDGTLDTDYRYWRVNDQTWTDSMSAAQANAQSVTNQTDGTWDNAPANAEWSCADVTNAVKTDVLLNNNFTTIRLVDVDALLSSIAGVDGSWSFIYYGSVSNFVGFRPSEYAGDSTKRPYMNITYSTDSCSCPGAGTEWQWDFADECTISTACTVENITCINSGTWKITSQVTATENFCKLAPGQNLKVGGQLKYKNGGT